MVCRQGITHQVVCKAISSPQQPSRQQITSHRQHTAANYRSQRWPFQGFKGRLGLLPMFAWVFRDAPSALQPFSDKVSKVATTNPSGSLSKKKKSLSEKLRTGQKEKQDVQSLHCILTALRAHKEHGHIQHRAMFQSQACNCTEL